MLEDASVFFRIYSIYTLLLFYCHSCCLKISLKNYCFVSRKWIMFFIVYNFVYAFFSVGKVKNQAMMRICLK